MVNRYAVMISLAVCMITPHSFADYSILETPSAISIYGAVCQGDYVWYTFNYRSFNSGISSDTLLRVGKLHLPTKHNQVFEVGHGKYDLSQIAVGDSSHIAIFQRDPQFNKKIYYYNGSIWKTFTNVLPYLKKIMALPSGKILLLSADHMGYIESDTIKIISHLDLGIDQYLVDMGKDNNGTAWIISKNHILSYRDSVWSQEFLCDSTFELSGVFTTIDGSVLFKTNKGHCTLINGGLEVLPDSGKIQSDHYIKDSADRVWKIAGDDVNSITFSDAVTYIGGSMFLDAFELLNEDTLINRVNAESYGWKNWPVLMLNQQYSIITCNNHVVLVTADGFYYYGNNNNKAWDWIPLTEIPKSGNPITKILFSPDSSVFLISDSYWIYKYNSNKFSSLPYFPLFGQLQTILIDHQNTLWLQGGGGLFKWQDPFYSPVSFEGFARIDYISEDTAGNLIFLSGNNIIKKNGSILETINESNSTLPIFEKGIFLQIHNGTYWLKTADDKGVKSIYTSKDMYNWKNTDYFGESLVNVNNVFVTSKGNLILERYRNNGPLFRYDGNQWDSLGAPIIPDDDEITITLCEDNSGNIWYGSGKIWHNNSSNSRKNNGILSVLTDTGWCILDTGLRVYDIKCDPLNQVWVATDQGLRVYKSATSNPISRYYTLRANSPKLAVNYSGQGKIVIDYTIDKNSDVNLSLFNLQGQKVKTLKEGFHKKGNYRLYWENRAAKGNYFLLLTTRGKSHTAYLRLF